MKNKLIFPFVFWGLTPFIGIAQQQHFLITGIVANYNKPAKVYLKYKRKDIDINDSVVVNNGTFEFSGEIEQPVSGYLALSPEGSGFSFGDYKEIYVERGLLKITGKQNLTDAAINGPEANSDNQRLYSSFANEREDFKKLKQEKDRLPLAQQDSGKFKTYYDRKVDDIIERRTKKIRKFIFENPDSYVSIEQLKGLTYNDDYNEVEPLYSHMSNRMKMSITGKLILSRLKPMKKTGLGQLAPIFTQRDTSGREISISSFKGKYVLLDFWASWCAPCRAENPNVAKAYEKYKGRNFTIIGISLDQPGGKNAWLAAIHQDGLSWTELSDLKYFKNDVAVLYSVHSIPTNFLIDPNGKIIGTNLRGEELNKKLMEIFNN